jgi:LmbE family N-acetylglucosaminyl deacetylase
MTQRTAAQRALHWIANGGGTALSLAVIAAHPDDETIGAGGHLARLGAALFVYVTDGAPRDLSDAIAAGFTTREEYAGARRQELSAALAVAGIEPRVYHFDYVDQEASLNLVALTRRLTDLLRDALPEAILTQPYEGGHPDHDATAFAVHAACSMFERAHGTAPVIVEMTSYHGRDGTMEVGSFLPRSGCEEITAVLSKRERDIKTRLFERYCTQQRVLQAFTVDVERFRTAPEYDFTEPPHEGQLFYEQFNWGMTGARWRKLARTGLEELQIA